MAKKLLQSYYEYDASTGTLIIPKFLKHEELLIITNVTLNTIVYNFADSTKGATSVTWNPSTEETSIVLASPAAGSNNVDKFQIFVDEPEQKMDVSDSLLDPVHKLRVSNPQNLIDTDFEYGLQPTKWETLELSNNIPSTYISDGQGYLSDVLSVVSTSGSDVITVTTQSEHGLDVGVPIDIQGLSSRSAEGKYIIKFVTSTTFAYQATAIQSITGTISGLYTQIAPGRFFNGSQISYREDLGITTSESTVSDITVTTANPHGFEPGSNFYLVNSIGQKTLSITDTTTSNAPDGKPYVHHGDLVTNAASPDLTQTETKKWIPKYSHKFSATDVNTTNDTISWPSHGLRDNDCLIYQHSSGDTAIGGLTNFQIYYVIKSTDDAIKLSTTYNGSAINFTSTGTNNYGRNLIGVVYEIYQTNNSGNYAYNRTTNNVLNTGSGWDLASTGNLGSLLTSMSSNCIYVSKNGTNVRQNTSSPTAANINSYMTTWTSYDNANYTMGQTGTTPAGLNFIENGASTVENFWNRYSSFYFGQPRNTRDFRVYLYSQFRTGLTTTWGHNDVFLIPLVEDEEADSFYIQNHQAVDGSPLTITYNSGNIKYTNGTSTLNTTGTNWLAEVISEDRIRLKTTAGTTRRIAQASGSYTFSISSEDSLRDSFYLPAHGLVDGQNLTFNLGTGGATPTTATGIIPSNIPTTTRLKFDAAKAAMDNHLTNTISNVTNFPQPTINNWNNGILQTTDPSYWSGFNQTYLPYNSYIRLYRNGAIQQSVFPATTSNLSTMASTNGWQPAGTNAAFDSIKPTWMCNDLTSGTHKGFLWMLDAEGYDYSDRQNGNYLRFDLMEIRNTWSGTDPGINYNQLGNQTYVGTNDTWRYTAVIYRNTIGGGQTVIWSIRARPTSEFNSTSYQSGFGYGGASQNYSAVRLYDSHNQNEITIMGVFNMTSTASFDNSTEWSAFLNSMLAGIDAAVGLPPLVAGNTYKTKVLTPNRIRLQDANTSISIDLSSSGTKELEFTTPQSPGVLDGAYTSTSVGTNTITFQTQTLVNPIDYSFDASQVSSNYIPVTGGQNYHHYSPGSTVTYSAEGNSPVGGLTNNAQYYVIPIDDQLISLANTYNNAINQNEITLTSSTGTHEIQSESISGQIKMPGTCALTQGSYKVVGTDTLFTRYFKPGDPIVFRVSTGSSPGDLETYFVSGITSDTTLILQSTAATTEASARAYTQTKLYSRPDGYAVHRPFDGGVEIAAGTSPYSQILRQTRKYFRYQSGKGIQTSLAINFNPPVIFEKLTSNGTTATGRTTYPHRLENSQSIKVKDSSDPTFNGTFNITVIDAFTFSYTLPQTPTSSIPSGIIKYNLNGYSGSAIRSGMFDFQNGFFFEYDGSTVNCVRRSSTTQLSGQASIANRNNEVNGTNTNFSGQLTAGDYIVIRGQTHRVTSIVSRTKMYVQPEYRGVSASDIIITKTEDVRVPQIDWNIDRCDGLGPEGFLLDVDKIQMAYMDYSWYGAGKIRFGFKDKNGHVRYVHEFLHNNRLDEAYMRSGNLPAKYEIINGAAPTYAPTLFHWGTSVIMDGKFDEDEAYLFTAQSSTFNFTAGDSTTITTGADSSLYPYYNYNSFTVDYYVQIPFATSVAGSFQVGTVFSTTNGALAEFEGETVDYADYAGGFYNAYIYVATRTFRQNPPQASTIPNGTVISIGGGDAETAVNLGQDMIPLVSLRLAPSVDSGLTGLLGQRDVINRMQLKLAEVGLVLSHDCTVKLLLNANLATTGWSNVRSPSLSQLYEHDFGETIDGGAEVFSFRAAGGTKDNTGKRLTNATNFSLDAVVDMGNSILGGDGVFPNGPDVLTVAVTVTDTSDVNSSNPFVASGRITWSESQA